MPNKIVVPRDNIEEGNIEFFIRNIYVDVKTKTAIAFAMTDTHPPLLYQDVNDGKPLRVQLTDAAVESLETDFLDAAEEQIQNITTQ